MKKLLLALFCLSPGLALTQTPPPAPATVEDVLAGTATYKFISPAAAAGAGLSSPTNGVTAATVTNIVNGLAPGLSVSNATYAMTASNLVSDVMRQDLYWMWAKISSNRPVRFLALGDSTTERSETFAGVRLAMQQLMAGGGYRTLYNDYPAAGVTNGGLIYYASHTLLPGTAGYSPMSYMALTNTEVLDTVAPAGGVPADTLSIDWIPCGGTSLTVATNTGVGSYSTRFVIDTSTGSGFQVTNVSLALGSNYNVRVTSSGSNNLVNIGLTIQNQSTNYHTWAKAFISGGLVNDIVTNVGFYKFFTNYAPDIIFAEDKAGGLNSQVLASMNWLKSAATNCDVVWITASPQAFPPEGGNASERNVQIEWANTNNAIVFDKWARFLPTNYWGNATFYEDASHLAYGGRSYIQSAFVKFLNLSQDRFAPSGLSVGGGGTTDISGKANLAGGNTFTGFQYFEGTVHDLLSVTGALGQISLGHMADVNNYARFFYASNAIRLIDTEWNTSPGAYGMVWSNNSGTLYVFGDPAFGTRYLGAPNATWNGSLITGIVPTTGIAGWPANSSGYLQNNGSGTLSWGTPSGSLPADPSVNSVLTNKSGGPSGWFPIASLPAGSGGGFYLTNSAVSSLWTNLFGGKWDNSGSSPIFSVGLNTYLIGGDGQVSRIGGGLELDAGTGGFFVGDVGLSTAPGDFNLHNGTINQLTVTGATTTGSLIPSAIYGPLTNKFPLFDASGQLVSATAAQIGAQFSGGSTYLKADGTTGAGGSGISNLEGAFQTPWTNQVSSGRRYWYLVPGTSTVLIGSPLAQSSVANGTGLNVAPTATRAHNTLVYSGATANNDAQMTISHGETVATNYFFWTRVEFTNSFTVRVAVGASVSRTTDDWSTLQAAGFRYSTAASDTTFKCITSAASTAQVIDSGVTFTQNTPYDLAIYRSNTFCYFYINGTVVATNTTLSTDYTGTQFTYFARTLDNTNTGVRCYGAGGWYHTW